MLDVYLFPYKIKVSRIIWFWNDIFYSKPKQPKVDPSSNQYYGKNILKSVKFSGWKLNDHINAEVLQEKLHEKQSLI